MLRREGIRQALHIFGLFNLAVAQPLLDILGKNATFFVANHLKTGDIILMVAGLCIAIPALLTGLVIVCRLFGKMASDVVLLVLVGILVGLIFLPFAKRIPAMPGIAMIVLSVLAGVGIAVLYARAQHIRSFMNAISLAIIIVPSVFLFASPVSKLVFESTKSSLPKSSVSMKNPVPIVMVIFDEFSLVSLMDSTHNIDSIQYPHFAELARQSYWFRNATTVAEQTQQAVPSILTGKRPQLNASALPTLTDYPNNLFTLLCGSYTMHVYESQTFLCPP